MGNKGAFRGRGSAASGRDDSCRKEPAGKGPVRDGASVKGKAVPARKGDSPSLVFPFPPAELLEKGLAALAFPPVDGDYRTVSVRGIQSILPLVSRYIKELELFNSVFDLVGAEPGTDQGRSDLVVRHILDSLSPWKEIAAEAARLSLAAGRTIEIADAGSGAGFPGIPLAIVFPGFHFTLVERMSKRCAFLENCVAVMGLKNVTVLNSEVEKAPAGQFDLVAFRAFRPLDRDMIRTLLAMTRPGDGERLPGELAAWKARADKISDEMEAIKNEVDGWKVLPVTVPFLEHEERHLVITVSAKRPNQPR